MMKQPLNILDNATRVRIIKNRPLALCRICHLPPGFSYPFGHVLVTCACGNETPIFDRDELVACIKKWNHDNTQKKVV